MEKFRTESEVLHKDSSLRWGFSITAGVGHDGWSAIEPHADCMHLDLWQGLVTAAQVLILLCRELRSLIFAFVQVSLSLMRASMVDCVNFCKV